MKISNCCGCPVSEGELPLLKIPLGTYYYEETRLPDKPYTANIPKKTRCQFTIDVEIITAHHPTRWERIKWFFHDIWHRIKENIF